MDMTRGSPMRLMVRFSLPLLFGNALEQFYNMVDSWVVGNFVGTSAMAAVGIAFPIIFLLTSLFIGMAVGTSILIAQFFGAGDRDGVRRSVDTVYGALMVSILPLTLLALLASGPILRPGIFFPQLREKGFLHPDWSDAAAGIYAICCGTIKKVLLADAFGTVVNNGWVHLEELSAPAAWLVILGYTLQLYFDFSGYCDIAAGVARLFGLRLPMNFDSPYRSASVTEFWKRWHITLTTFLRECLYFPLGGSRRGTIRTYCNILIVFLVSGFWHGAGWTFLVWGALHGLAQVVERVWGRGRDRLPFVLRWGLTFLFVNIAWVFFRAPDCAGALELLGRAVTGGFAKPAAWLLEGLFAEETSAVQMLIPAFTPWKNILRVVLLYGAGMVAVLWPRNTIRRMEDFRPTLWRGAALTVLTLWCVLSFTGVTTFIYSNF